MNKKKEFRTKETFAKPTSFLKKRGVVKVGYFMALQTEHKEDGLHICCGSAAKYYNKDGTDETVGGIAACITIPNELKEKLRMELTEI